MNGQIHAKEVVQFLRQSVPRSRLTKTKPLPATANASLLRAGSKAIAAGVPKLSVIDSQQGPLVGEDAGSPVNTPSEVSPLPAADLIPGIPHSDAFSRMRKKAP